MSNRTHVFILGLLLHFIIEVFGETAVLILARGGSKGIRLKNLQTIGSVSLLSRAIRNAKEAGLSDITVSTDHPLIALEALRNGAAIIQRSRITAVDWAPSIWGAAEFVSKRPEVSILVLLQATSPFMNPKRLEEAVWKLKYPIPYDCAFSAVRTFKLRWQKRRSTFYPINFNIYARPRRQDWDGELIETGAFYISRRNLIESGIFQNLNCTIVEVSAAESLEVDTYHDLRVANALLRSNLAL